MSISETQIDRPHTRGHRGCGHAAQRADKFEIERAMSPENPHAGRLVPHGSGRAGLICEWRAGDESDDYIGASRPLPPPSRSAEYRARERVATGDLVCQICGQPITFRDLDEVRDLSRKIYRALPVDKHLSCAMKECHS